MTESQAARLVSLLLIQANTTNKLPIAWKVGRETYEDWPPDIERPDRYCQYISHDRTQITFMGGKGEETFRIIAVKV